MKRKIASLLMMLSFVVLCISGILSYFTEYTRGIASVHTVFGMIFMLIAIIHMSNNFKPIKAYLKTWHILPLFALIGALVYFSSSESYPINRLMEYGARSKAKMGQKVDSSGYAEINMNLDNAGLLNFELKRGKHFWHPQIAIWTEDTLGNYLQTLYVTKATAKGIFSGGRTKDNFKLLDGEHNSSSDAYRRVNALPIWSHKRGVRYADGQYVPSYNNPLPDAITGATPLDNFRLKTSVNHLQAFVVKLEINVAFDDNEYFSEFDFPDDETFHNGTGQLGQPSLVFKTILDPSSTEKYQLMRLDGRGHHSAKNGKIIKDFTKLTTALEIVDYIIVGFTKNHT